jgi:uncharacterized protein (TIGR02996 family)
MAIPLLDLDHLAKACVDGDLDAFAAAPQLGWTLTEDGRAALLRALADTNFHRTYSYGVSSFTVAQAIGLISEAANNAAGIAITEQIRSLRLGKEVAIAFRHAGQVHFGIRYASNLPMTPGHLWAELKPWFKAIERNRPRLEQWIAAAEGLVTVPLRASPTSEVRGRDELLAAVIADPDDVTARLVYADWLLAQGDVQGELIQLSEQQRSGGDDPSLTARINQLNEEFGERIAGEVAQLARHYTLARGFVTRIKISAPSFAKHGERLLAQHPIERLELDPVNDKALARLAKVPALARIRVLQLSQIIGRQRPLSLDLLCGSPHFDALRRLELWNWQTAGDPQQAFSRWRAPRLESLFLYEVDRAPQILAGLAGNELQLRDLEIIGRGRDDWPPVLAAPAFARLRHLRLAVGGEQLHQLFDGAHLPELVALEVGYQFPVERIRFSSLERLDMDGPLHARGFVELLEHNPRLRALETGADADAIPQIIDHALALPPNHPLQVLSLPVHEPTQLARISQRFSTDFYAEDADD